MHDNIDPRMNKRHGNYVSSTFFSLPVRIVTFLQSSLGHLKLYATLLLA